MSTNPQSTVREVETTCPPLEIRQRSRCAALEEHARASGFPEALARVIAARPLASDGDLPRALKPTLADLDSAATLADIDRAARRLARAIASREVIGVQTDYDMDGLGAHASFRMVLIELFGHPPERLRSFVGHRLNEGYGLTADLAQRILEDDPRPSLLVTADCGSNDDARIAQLRRAGIEVIVTDHHELNQGEPPPSAYACLNPKRADCRYPDPHIAGGMVLWLLLQAVRDILCESGHPAARAADLTTVLDYIACSTVADCMSLASRNNRAVVLHGSARMRRPSRPCWRALEERLGPTDFRAETLAYQVAPRVNARSRLADPLAALHFLLARDRTQARAWLDVLDRENQRRKQIERRMIDETIGAAAAQVRAGRSSICLELPDGHAGVQGICSSRLVEMFGRPVFLLSPSFADAQMLTGSGRSIEDADLRRMLETVAQRERTLIQKFGGHKAAAGVTIRREDHARFDALFEETVRAHLAGRDLTPFRWSDGELAPLEWTYETLEAFDWLEPTGRGFAPPVFDGVFHVLQVRAMGDGTHLRLILEHAGTRIGAVWFGARRHPADPLPIAPGASAHFLYRLTENRFKGASRLELRIEARCLALPSAV